MKLFKDNIFFYHSHIRKLISVFGYVFSDITVAKFNDKGEITKLISPIPIQFANADSEFLLNKELVNSKDDEKLGSGFKEEFPRMTYHMDNIGYNPERKHSKNNVIKWVDERGINRHTTASVPYTASFTLNIITKHHIDAMQVFEQVAAKFQPSIVVKIRDYPVSGNIYDLPISLVASSIEDNYETMTEKRRIVYSIEFEVMFRLYGPTGSTIEYDALIKKLENISGNEIRNDNDINNLKNKSSDMDALINKIDCFQEINNNSTCIELKFTSVDNEKTIDENGNFCYEKELSDYTIEEISDLEDTEIKKINNTNG